MSKKIVLTGGGTAGHVTPNLALLPKLQSLGYEVVYMGSKNGIEKRLIEDYQIPYYGVSSGKLRRYLDPQNITDPFKVIHGFAESMKLLKEIKPDVVFSKGGFVSVPVVRAAAARKIPCIIHESDMTPGLANKLCIPVAASVCCNFPETLSYIPKEKALLTGSPIREELLHGDPEKAREICGFTDNKPVVMVTGGSQGASSVNKVVRDALDMLLKDFNVVHLCGKGKLDNIYLTTEGYKQFEYIKSDMKDIFALAEVVISRAGANAICELQELKKPNILIPLPAQSSRGDQLQNANSFEAQGFSVVINEDDLTPTLLTERVHEVFFNKTSFIKAMSQARQVNSVDAIVNEIERVYQESITAGEKSEKTGKLSKFRKKEK